MTARGEQVPVVIIALAPWTDLSAETSPCAFVFREDARTRGGEHHQPGVNHRRRVSCNNGRRFNTRRMLYSLALGGQAPRGPHSCANGALAVATACV